MKRKLEVFISSKQDEFKKKRKEVAKLISNHLYLESTPLEMRGADAENPTDASVKAVKKSDIYIGIFGKKYSETTVKEYRESVKRKIPCLIYLKKTKQREQKLLDFLESDVKSNFKFYEFSSNKKLLQQIENDLNEFIFDLLQDGLEQYKNRKKKIIRDTKETFEKVENIIKKKETVTYLDNFFTRSLTQQDYLRVVLGTSASIEGLAKEALAKLGYMETELRKPLGWILHRLLAARLINESDIEKINQIQYIRNDAVHRGRLISKNDAVNVLRLASDVTKKLTDIKSKPNIKPENISIQTDKLTYKHNETIRIFGGVQVMLSGVPIGLQIIKPEGNLAEIQQIKVRGNGTFETTVKTGGPMWAVAGEYKIKAIYGHEKNTTKISIRYMK